jgi:uncharacterized OB-fold protein
MTLASNWRTKRQRLGLVGEECPHCRTKLFPPRDVCPHCHGPAKTPFSFEGTGEVYSFSRVSSPPQGFEASAPYYVALIKLDEGPLITAQLTDLDQDQVYVGMPVEMVTRKMREEGSDGLIIYNYKFRPLLAQQTA